MNMSLLSLEVSLCEYVSLHLGKEWGDWLANLFRVPATDSEVIGIPDVIRVGFTGPLVGDAPPEIIAAMKKLITDYITTKLANRPAVKVVVLLLVNNMSDGIINQIWNSFFQASQAKVMAAGDRFEIPDGLLSAACAEAGIAA